MASHNFSNNGNYVVAHTVYNASGCGVTSYDTINVNNAVNNPGQADFYYDYNVCADCCCDNKIQFHNTSSGSANTYLWSFGDGFTSTQPEPYKGYGASGYYNVNLTAFHAPGCFTTASKLIYVSEDATGPSAAFKVNQRTQCQLSNNFHFTNYSQYMGVGYILKYYWNFGDGTIDSTSTHVYNKKYSAAGTYTVRLVAKGIKNCYDTMLLEVVVDPCILGNVVNAGNNDGLNSNLTFLKNNPTSVNTITQEASWALYPNPNAGVFTVNTNMDASNMTLKVVDLLGREIEATVVRSGNAFVINADNIMSGSYIVTVFEGETQVQRLKFVVNK
jgi:PKD repeat protein